MRSSEETPEGALWTDTPRQRRLQAKILTDSAAASATWRSLLVHWNEAGLSGQEIAYRLWEEYGIRVDQSTASRWLRQAREETSRMPDRETAAV